MPIPAHIQKAIQAYYAERATPDEVAALEEWFRADEAHIRIFAEHGMVEWQILCQQEKTDVAAILTMLREAEENAEPDFSLLLETPAFNAPTDEAKDEALTLQEVWSVASYALAKALRTKAAAIGSIAAVLALGVVLYLSFFGLGSTPESPEFANNTQPKPAESAQPILRDHTRTTPVATLTATHNAQWAQAPSEVALAAGSPLHPNQRITLTAGFAEITTNDGAIAILEAPATIELLNNENALRLHSGKLVGICETESSKGFLVRTSNMDVIDLGTRFGIAVDTSDNVLAEVFEGRVAVKRSVLLGVSREAIELTAGEAFAQSALGQAIPRDRFAANEFTSLNHFSAGIRLSGQIRFASSGFLGREVADWPTGADVFLIEELRDHWLNADIPLTIHEPGTYLRFEATQASATVPASTVIRSYVVLFNPGSDRNRGPYTAEGEITFSGEILGVTTNEDDWQAFIRSVNDQTSQPVVTGPKGFAALEYHGQFPQVTADLADRIVIADDRRTLGFKLSVLGNAEAVRVIVREPAGATSP